MVCFMSRRSWGKLGGGRTEAESGVSRTSLGALLGAQMEAELTTFSSLVVTNCQTHSVIYSQWIIWKAHFCAETKTERNRN
jgi:hypothetical protein